MDRKRSQVPMEGQFKDCQVPMEDQFGGGPLSAGGGELLCPMAPTLKPI